MNRAKMIEANYHSHTFRCGHAVGTDEEYVQCAIQAGLKVLGFTDHVILPHHSQPGMRGDFSLLKGYIQSVNDLKKKYAGKIDIYLGFECEWYYGIYEPYYRDLLLNEGFDYLILGQHCCLPDGENFVFYSHFANRLEGLKAYTKDVLAAMDSGLFAYVAHPDHFMLWYGAWDEEAEKASRLICKKAKEKNIPLEINMGPSRWAKKTSVKDPSILCYPYPKFFEIAKQTGNSVVIGVDAHAPSEYQTSDYAWALNFAEALGFKPLKRVDFPKVC